MKCRVVYYKDILKSKRFDGSYHNADVNIYNDVITSHSEHNLQYYCTSIFTSGRNKRTYTEPEFGVPFLSNADVSSQSPLMSCKYSSKKYGFDETAVLKGGMILTGRVGAIGQTSFVPKYWERYNAMGSDNIIRIVVKPEYKNGFIYAYLASKMGNLSFWKHATGGVQPFITDAMVGNLPIPSFSDSFQQKVDELIQESARLREEAAGALEKAVDYFNNKFPISNETTKTFTLGLKDLKLGFAAYNNNLEVDDFINGYIDNSYELENKTSKIFAPPLFKHIYLTKDNGYPFMTGSELTQFNLRYYRWLSPRGVKDINDYVVKKGTLLLYKSGTTDGGILGNVFIADKKLDGCCLSDHVIRVVFNDEKQAYWAFAFLRSKGGVRLLQRLATGTMIPFITPERLSHISIPNPDDNFNSIIEFVETYIDKNSESKENEDLAISMVEEEIDKWNN